MGYQQRYQQPSSQCLTFLSSMTLFCSGSQALWLCAVRLCCGSTRTVLVALIQLYTALWYADMGHLTVMVIFSGSDCSTSFTCDTQE